MKKENNDVVVVENNTTNESQEQFINENISVVPKLRMKKFMQLSLDEQVKSINHYIELRRIRQEWEERAKVINRVKDIFERKHATVDDAQEVLSFCEDFINNYKQKEIDKLDEEIRKLQEKRNALQG